jgi:hypothetical protein
MALKAKMRDSFSLPQLGGIHDLLMMASLCCELSLRKGAS